LGGFGNLAGEMEIWDIRDIKKIGSCKKDKVILFSWADTGEYFLVATTFPRLRVNNMI
jgi:translation initiation factor 2A